MAYELLDEENVPDKPKGYLLLDDEPEPAPEAKVEDKPSYAKGLAQQYGQGLLFNFADELSGALGGDTAQFRKESESFKKDNPWAASTAEIAGGITPALIPGLGPRIVGKNPVLASRFGPAMRYMTPPLMGAMYGGLAGAGASDIQGEDTFDTAVQRAKAAVPMAATGLIMTPAMMGAANVLKGVTKATAGLFSKKFAEKEGVEHLARVMKEEGLDPAWVAQQVEERTKATKKPVMWMDFIDPDKYPKTYNLVGQGLLGGETTAAKMQLLQRGEGTVGRLVDDVREKIHKRGETAFDDMMSGRQTRSAEWKAAFDPIKGMPVDTPEVIEVLNRPFAMEAIGLAIRNAKDRGDTRATSMLANFVSNDPATGQFVWRKAPTLELIQTIKNLGYSPALKSVYQGKPVTTDTGTILKQQRDLMTAVDNAIPEYAKIRKNFADSADIDNARELGANLQGTLTKGAEGVGGKIKGVRSDEVISEYKAMSKAEKDAFLQGLASTMTENVRAKAHTEGATKTLALLGDPSASDSAKIQQLRSILGNTKRFKNFLERLGTEETIEKTTREFQRRRGASFDETPGVMRDIVRLAGAAVLGRPGAAIPALGSTTSRFVTGKMPSVMQPIGTLGVQTAGSTNPLIRQLNEKYGRYDPAYQLDDLFAPMFISGAGQAPVEYKKGGLVHACECMEK